MINGKQFYHLGRKKTTKVFKEHSHNTHTQTHRTRRKRHKQALHETLRQTHPCEDKTAYSTPRYRRSQSSAGGWRSPGEEEENFQRTLAVKAAKGVHRFEGGSSLRKNTKQKH